MSPRRQQEVNVTQVHTLSSTPGPSLLATAGGSKCAAAKQENARAPALPLSPEMATRCSFWSAWDCAHLGSLYRNSTN
eukprot:scaffold257155_cov33-Prasinocladus_malaysianus.AAC.1